MRKLKVIQIKKNGHWVSVNAIISNALLCKKPGCNRKPFGQSNNNKRRYCCNKHAQQHIWSKKDE